MSANQVRSLKFLEEKKNVFSDVKVEYRRHMTSSYAENPLCCRYMLLQFAQKLPYKVKRFTNQCVQHP